MVECKYSSDKEILVFEYPEIENIDLSHFPLMVNGQSIFDVPPHLAHSSLPLLVERLVEMDHSSASKEKDNYRDIGVHKACEQIISALRHNLDRRREGARRQYLDMSKESQIGALWRKSLQEKTAPTEEYGNGTRIPASFINKFLQDNYDPIKMAKDFRTIPIHLYFPIILTDANRGIIQAKLNTSYEVVDLEDRGICLYTYISENADRFEIVLDNAFALPILICNLPNLTSAIDVIERSIDYIIEQTRQRITTNPWLIPKEVIFNNKVSGF